jgi:hypothetical protein
LPEWCQQIWPTWPRSWWSIWWNLSPLPYDVEHEEEREPPFSNEDFDLSLDSYNSYEP